MAGMIILIFPAFGIDEEYIPIVAYTLLCALSVGWCLAIWLCEDGPPRMGRGIVPFKASADLGGYIIGVFVLMCVISGLILLVR